jgi:hypothetical protein
LRASFPAYVVKASLNAPDRKRGNPIGRLANIASDDARDVEWQVAYNRQRLSHVQGMDAYEYLMLPAEQYALRYPIATNDPEYAS